MITITDAQRNSLQITRKGIVLVRLFYGDETADTDYIAIASQALPAEWTDTEYRPLLLTSPVTASGLDMFTHKFKTSELRLELSNGDYHPGVKFSDLVTDSSLGAGNDWGFENRVCEIRLKTQGVATWNNSIQLFKGVIRDIEHTATRIIFSIQDEREIIHRPIENLLTDSDAADTDQGLPDESRGKTKPIIHGTHIFLKGDDAKSNDIVSNLNNMVPFVYIGIDSSGRHRWVVAKHIINEILTATGQGQIWGWDDRINRFVRLNAFTVEQNTSSGCIISTDADPLFLDYWYAKGTVSETFVGVNVALDNKDRLADKAFDLFASLNVGALAGIGDSVTATIPFADYDNQGLDDTDDISAVKAYVYGLMIYSGGTTDTDFELTLDGLSLSPDRYPTNSGTHPAARSSVTMANANKADIAKNIDLKLIKNIVANSATCIYQAYEVYKEVQYKPHRNLPLFFAGKGNEYDTWINSRTQTENHADNGGSGNLIENIAGQIESIYREELSRVTADIDLASFNVASNDNTDVFAFSILKIDDSLERIRKMGQDGRLFDWLQPDGTIKAKVLENTYSASDRKIDFKQTINPKFTRSKPTDLFTAVKVQYNYDGNEHQSATTVAEDTVMQSKYNITEAESTLIYDSRHIHNSTTATNLRSYLLAQWKQPHNIISFGAGLGQIDLDIGDIIEFSNVPFKIFGEDITANATRAGQTIYKFWWIFDVKRSSTGIKIKAFQLHDLS